MATFSKITEQGIASSLNGSDYVVVVAGGTLKRITLDNLRVMMEENQQQFLDENAFYIEENTASPRGSRYVETGGNELVRQTWLSKITGILISPDGSYCRLNPNDSRYTIDGDQVVLNGAVVDAYKNADWMGMLDGGYWNYLQEVIIGGVKYIRHHIAFVPLPGGWYTPNVPVGMYKCSVVSGQLRSIPFVVPRSDENISAFFSYAQARGKNFGLAGEPFRNLMLQYIMAKYKDRDVQNIQTSDGTKVFGPGLDGTEKKSATATTDNFARQKAIQTGACLALGCNDGNVAVLDKDGGTCHSVNVGVWENPYGQYWEMDGHLCSVGTDVYQWDSNFLPQVKHPTAAYFANVAHTKLQHAKVASDYTFAFDISLITTSGAQRASYVPRQPNFNISYGDFFAYTASGQLWQCGGCSSDLGSICGLASAVSNTFWLLSSSRCSARLDFHGAISEVTSAQLKTLL